MNTQYKKHEQLEPIERDLSKMWMSSTLRFGYVDDFMHVLGAGLFKSKPERLTESIRSAKDMLEDTPDALDYPEDVEDIAEVPELSAYGDNDEIEDESDDIKDYIDDDIDTDYYGY